MTKVNAVGFSPTYDGCHVRVRFFGNEKIISIQDRKEKLFHRTTKQRNFKY